MFWLNLIGSLGFSLFQNVGLLAILAIFLPKWYMGEKLDLGDSFALVAMIYYLFFSVNGLTYYSMQTMQQACAVIYRLSEVFRMEEHKRTREEKVVDGEPVIKLDKMEYAWGFRVSEDQSKMKMANKARLELESSNTSVLREINLELNMGDLLIVVGKIGTGKTSLLYSMMDETVKKSGTHNIRGKIAYVEQEPFIFSASIEENICFGLEFAECRFKKAVKAAQLEDDFEQFSNGWKTTIGERGINISGGQKARISLARAIYQDADIYLLDDPLSAVDPAVANGIFQHAIQGALKHKCVVLVTH
mgnify:CR=1 FL=1